MNRFNPLRNADAYYTRPRTLCHTGNLMAVVLSVLLIAGSGTGLAQASDPFLGQLALVPYNFPPQGWAFCEGQLLPISQNIALFALIGTTFGGDGVTSFALPDLRGRVPIGAGQGPGLSNYDLGQAGGEESHTLITSEMPAHVHPAYADSGVGASDIPTNNLPARNAAGIPQYGTNPGAILSSSSVGVAGGSQPHNTLQPYLTFHWIIALQGVFPPQSSQNK